ncbi:MAG: MBL fold metallo-hydrolase, partial [Chitinophagaceae bacterium]
NASYPGIPQLQLHDIDKQSFRIGDLEFIPIRVMHYTMEVLGFRIGPFTYITDANFIAPKERDKIRGSEAVVLNALRNETHISHFTLPEAIEVAQDLAAPNTYFTHISHQLGLHEEVNKGLPEGIQLAYDGLTLQFPD